MSDAIKRQSANEREVDPEIERLREAYEALRGMDRQAQRRALIWLEQRLADDETRGHRAPVSPPPSRIGPTEPDDTMVICPAMNDKKNLRGHHYERIRKALAMAPTPGPWVVDRLSGSGRLQVNAPSSHTVAIICHNVYIPEEVHAANARLIAAAPDLIAALKEALPVLEFEAEARGDSDHLYEIPVRPILRVVLAAIARAEGRSDE